MSRILTCLLLAGLTWAVRGIACAAPAVVDQDVIVALDALGGQYSKNAAGEIIGVDLRHAWVTDADLETLARLPKLESINLAYTKITDLGLEELVPLANVKVLNLYYAEYVTDLGIAHLKHWKNLEYLNVRGAKVTSSLFEHLSKMTQLKFLDVGHSRVNDDFFENLAGLERLSHFSFGGNKMSGAALPQLKLLPALRELSVSGSQRTDSGLWNVAVTDFNLDHIAQLDRLQVLDLGETGISDRGLARLAQLKDLHTLDLRGTRITGKGLASLTGQRSAGGSPAQTGEPPVLRATGLPRLRHLKLWRAKVIDDAAVPVLLQFPSLEILELPETSVTAAGLMQLTQNQGLKQLLIGGLDITPEQLDAIRRALPNCRVSWWENPGKQ